jgi:hypothetical protein
MRFLIGLAMAVLAIALSGGAAQAQDTWNGLALDMAGGYSIVTGAANEDAARQQAVDQCGSSGCQSVIATTLPCMSIADTPEGGYNYGWATGNTEEGPRYIALGYCIESGYPGCKTLVSQCIGADTPQTSTPGPGPKTKTKG